MEPTPAWARPRAAAEPVLLLALLVLLVLLVVLVLLVALVLMVLAVLVVVTGGRWSIAYTCDGWQNGKNRFSARRRAGAVIR